MRISPKVTGSMLFVALVATLPLAAGDGDFVSARSIPETRVSPGYPVEAFPLGVEAEVTVAARVRPDGTVAWVEPMTATVADVGFEQAAVDKNLHAVAGKPGDDIRRLGGQEVAHGCLERLVLEDVELDLDVGVLGGERGNRFFERPFRRRT